MEHIGLDVHKRESQIWIDQTTYDRQRDKLREEMALVEIELHEAGSTNSMWRAFSASPSTFSRTPPGSGLRLHWTSASDCSRSCSRRGSNSTARDFEPP